MVLNIFLPQLCQVIKKRLFTKAIKLSFRTAMLNLQPLGRVWQKKLRHILLSWEQNRKKREILNRWTLALEFCPIWNFRHSITWQKYMYLSARMRWDILLYSKLANFRPLLKDTPHRPDPLKYTDEVTVIVIFVKLNPLTRWALLVHDLCQKYLNMLWIWITIWTRTHYFSWSVQIKNYV